MEHGGGTAKGHLYWSRIDDERGPLLEEEGVNQPPFDCAWLGTYQQLTRDKQALEQLRLREMPVRCRRGCLLYMAWKKAGLLPVFGRSLDLSLKIG